MQWIHERFHTNIRHACRLAGFSRAAWYKSSQAKDWSALRLRIREIAYARPRFGYERITVMLRREGWRINRKRVHRWYCLEGLQLRMRVRRRKHMSLHRGPVPTPQAAQERWSMDFVHDQLIDGRPFRMLTVVDQWSRQSPVIEPAFSFSGMAVAGVEPRTVRIENAAIDHCRPWYGIHLESVGRMGLSTWRQARLHSPRKTYR